MGIDLHGLNFLRFVRRSGPFGATVMIGRQGVHLKPKVIEAHLGQEARAFAGQYAEPMLMHYFGATEVESIDFSDYERASIIHDFNLPVPDALHGRFDTVIDFGTLEHVFQIPQALKNCSLLAKSGGQILHVLPANNLCGHGFWQFSPELFLSLYSTSNGYRDTELLLADLRDTAHWHPVQPAPPGERITVRSAAPVYILVRTVKAQSGFSHDSVQQSDYLVAWDAAAPPELPARPPFWRKLLRSLHKRRGRLDGTRHLRKIAVGEAVRSGLEG